MKKRFGRRPATALAAGLTAVAVLAPVAIAGKGKGPGGPPPRAFEEVVFIDPAAPFHGGPPPHAATDAATDFRLTQGGLRWLGSPVVKYGVSAAGCSDDCGSAVAKVNLGLDAWEVSGVTFTQDEVSPSANPCTGSGNSVSWSPIDGLGGTLAFASVCRVSRAKEIVGFRIVFDSGDTWSDSGDSGKFDIQATAAHEAGHVLGLDHVSVLRAARLTMFPTLQPGEFGPRTLGCGDRLGVNALYGTSLTCTVLPGD